mmetsp:Transcript_39129/g.58776  ORF Transcript_39129/g.58776 Transcript_39129/m.58776 type:complete len:115 (-) Transcript_39129:46-390(-)
MSCIFYAIKMAKSLKMCCKRKKFLYVEKFIVATYFCKAICTHFVFMYRNTHALTLHFSFNFSEPKTQRITLEHVKLPPLIYLLRIKSFIGLVYLESGGLLQGEMLNPIRMIKNM